MKRLIIAGVFSSLVASSVYGQTIYTDGSAGQLFKACRSIVSTTARIEDPSNQGRCFGIVEALGYVGAALPPQNRFCSPAISVGEAIKVVVAYADKHTDRWNDRFVIVAAQALREAWPCKEGQ
jgi:hypothetical protein